MGYYSEVVAVVGMPTKDFFVQTIGNLRLQGGDAEAIQFFIDNSKVMEYPVEPIPWLKEQDDYVPLPENSKWYVWEFHHKWTKWLWAEPTWEKIRNRADECGCYAVELRVGEDSTDTESNAYGGDTNALYDYMKQLGMFSGSSDALLKSYSKQYDYEMSCVGDPYNIITGIDKDYLEQDTTVQAEEVLNGKL